MRAAKAVPNQGKFNRYKFEKENSDCLENLQISNINSKSYLNKTLRKKVPYCSDVFAVYNQLHHICFLSKQTFITKKTFYAKINFLVL